MGNRGYSQVLIQALGLLASPGLTSNWFCICLPKGLSINPSLVVWGLLVLCAPVAVAVIWGVLAPALSPSGWCPHVEGGYLQSHLVTDSGGGGSGEIARLDHCPPLLSLPEGLSGICPVWMREGEI